MFGLAAHEILGERNAVAVRVGRGRLLRCHFFLAASRRRWWESSKVYCIILCEGVGCSPDQSFKNKLSNTPTRAVVAPASVGRLPPFSCRCVVPPCDPAAMAEPSAEATEAAESYADSLTELTFNSKPIINSLTMIAEELLPHASAIAKTIERTVAARPADKKLPLLYLLDSICKNVGGAYVDAFAANLPTTIGEAYAATGPKVRASLQKLVATWKGVFPSTTVEQASARVNSDTSSASHSSGPALVPLASSARAPPLQPQPQLQPQPPDQLERAAEVAHARKRAREEGEEELRVGAAGLVKRINTHLASGLAPDAQLIGFVIRLCSLYTQIIARLAPMSPEHTPFMIEFQKAQQLRGTLEHAIETEAPLPAIPPLAEPPLSATALPPPPQKQPVVPSPPTQPQVRPPPPPSLPKPTVGGSAGVPGSVPLGAPAAPAVDVSKLLASLAAAGVLKPNAPPVDARSNRRSPANVPPPPPPGLAKVLWEMHERRPLQCKVCGLRFEADGRDELREHMDFHFRRNMRGKGNGVAPPSRRWLLPLAKWITHVHDEKER
jgi:pre-mRNA cleavage complex 2 protein Pcf11